jgi:cytochrome c-type biogenesis protein CcmH
MGVVLAVALVVGLQADDSTRTNDDRAHAIADGLKCPTCRSQSVADSDAPVSKEIRADIARRIEAGETDEEIRAYLIGRFGEDIVLTPRSSGVTGLVWIIPVVALVLATAGLVFAFRRWRDREPMSATEDDRELVERIRSVMGDGDGDR